MSSYVATEADLYGKGLSFPPRVGVDGRMVVSSGELNVRESVCLILRTGRGERVEMADFGCGLDKYLYEPNDLATLRQIQEDVKRSLAAWEPRIALDDVRVAVDPLEPRAITITVLYTLIATGQTARADVGVTLGSA